MTKQISNQQILGSLGEELVAKFFGIQVNENHYDTEKDLVLPNGETIEVKTQTRHPKKGVFSFKAPSTGDSSSKALKGLNNVLKCMSVDHLIFIEYDNSDIIKAYSCVNRKTYTLYTTAAPWNLNMIGFPIDKMKPLFQVEDAELAKQMRMYSQSSYIKKD